MYNYKVKVRIHNPEVEKEIDVPLYSSLQEAISNLTTTKVLEMVNDHIIYRKRVEVREEMIKEVMKGKKRD